MIIVVYMQEPQMLLLQVPQPAAAHPVIDSSDRVLGGADVSQ